MTLQLGARERGFSIVEVLIALAILSIVTMGFLSMMDFVRKDIKTANRKMDALELRTTTTRSLGDLATCGCQLNSYGASFDSTNATPEFAIERINATCGGGSAALLATGEIVPGSTGNLEVESIKMLSIQSMGIADRYRGKFHVEFKNDGFSHPMKGFEVEVRFRTDPAAPADAKKVVQCDFVGTASGGAGGGGGITGVCPSGQYISAIQNGVVSCSGVAMGGMASNAGGHSLTDPGPVCDGSYCVTGDFGPCDGSDCVTNGNYCDGSDCVACGPTPSCTGSDCNARRAQVCARHGFAI